MTNVSNAMTHWFFSCRSDSRGQRTDTDVLLRTLVEAEIDGVAVANQLTALKETVDSLTKVSSDSLTIRCTEERCIWSCFYSSVYSVRTSACRSCTPPRWDVSRSCWWRRWRCLITRTRVFGSCSGSGANTRCGRFTRHILRLQTDTFCSK